MVVVGRGSAELHIHSSTTKGGSRQRCCLGYFVSQEQVWLIDELWAQQQAAMPCHLGPSQGKYCDRAFTFVPFPRLELDHTTETSPPQNTHTHGEKNRHTKQHKDVLKVVRLHCTKRLC